MKIKARQLHPLTSSLPPPVPLHRNYNGVIMTHDMSSEYRQVPREGHGYYT